MAMAAPTWCCWATTAVYFLPQQKDHTLGEPQKIPFSGAVKSVQVVDIDGDGRSDLLLVNWEDRNPFRFRLQKTDGELGPEIYFSTAPIRSYWADNLEQNKKTQVITIAQNSGRAQISEFTRKPGRGAFRRLPPGPVPGSAAQQDRPGAARPACGPMSTATACPICSWPSRKAARFPSISSRRMARWPPPKTFPTLAGVSDLAVADWNGDGKPEIFMLSADERQVGVTRLG